MVMAVGAAALQQGGHLARHLGSDVMKLRRHAFAAADPQTATQKHHPRFVEVHS